MSRKTTKISDFNTLNMRKGETKRFKGEALSVSMKRITGENTLKKKKHEN